MTLAMFLLVALIVALVWLVALLSDEVRADRQAYLAAVSERERIARRDSVGKRNGQRANAVHSAAGSRQPIMKHPKSLNVNQARIKAQDGNTARRLRGTDER